MEAQTDWTSFNRKIGVSVGKKDSKGRVITAAAMKSEPFFCFANGKDEGISNLVISVADQSIKENMKMSHELVEETAEKLLSAGRILTNASQSMGKDSKALADTLKLNASQVKDYAERLNTSLAKFGSVVNSDKLRKDVENVERLVVAMERLAELDASGKLASLMGALK